MSEQPLRGGLIGCGFFAVNHLHAWRELAEAEIVAVCDLDPDKARAAAARFGVRGVYHDAAVMLDAEALDFVDIVTTMDSHRALVETAARRRVPAIVQKPFAPSLDDARAMVEACASAGVTLMVHENFRWQTPLRAVRKLIDDGAVGEPFFARVAFRHGNPVGYQNQPYLFEQPQYIINDVGIHLFDLARFYCGEVSSVYAELQRVDPRFKGEDVATVLLRHDGGACSIVELSVSTRIRPDPFPQTLVRVEGREGSIELGQDYALRVSSDGGLQQLDAAPLIYPWAEQPWAVVQESVVNIQRHWCECLRAGRSPETDGADNLRTLALTFHAYESARQKRPLEI